MKRSFAAGILFVLLMNFAVAPLSAQGTYWESTTTGMGGEHVSQMYYLSKMFKSVTTDEDGGRVVIVRLDKEKIYTLSPKEKTYSEMTFNELEATMKKMGSEMDSHMAEMNEQLASMPPEQRKMVEEMMKKQMNRGGGDEVKVEKTGDSKTISGYSCTKFLVKQDDKEMATIWTTKDLKAFESMRGDFQEFSKRMMSMNPMTKGMGEGMQKVEGFPIETDGARGFKQVVTKVEKRSIAASEFEIPADYKKVKSELQEHNEKEE